MEKLFIRKLHLGILAALFALIILPDTSKAADSSAAATADRTANAAVNTTLTTPANQAQAMPADLARDPAMPAAMRSDLDLELQKLADRYRAVREDLDDQYNALVKERDDNAQQIFDRVTKLKEDRKAAVANFEEEYRGFRSRMTDANVSTFDRHYQDQEAEMRRNRQADEAAYEASMDTLQQLYQLNGKRFNDMVKVHDMRETLEERRYRAERDYAAQRLRFEERARRANMTERDRQRYDVAIKAFDDMNAQLDARYNNSLRALDELQKLIDNRVDAQRKYLQDHESIMNEMAQHRLNVAADNAAAANAAAVNAATSVSAMNVAPVNPAAVDPAVYNPAAYSAAAYNATAANAANADNYRQRLRDLERQRNIDERAYRANVQLLEEQLTLQQIASREVESLDNVRMAIEQRRMRQQDRLDQARADLNNRLNAQTITAEQRTAMDEEARKLDQMADKQQEDYNRAIQALDQKRDLLERSIQQRGQYLQDRNQIRIHMAETPMDADNFNDLRSQVTQLEEKRIQDEKALRDEMMQINSTIPAVYHVRGVGVRDRNRSSMGMTSRMEGMRRTVDQRWEREQQDMNRRIQALQNRLQSQDISQQDRERYQQMLDDAQEQLRQREQQYQSASQEMDNRKKLMEDRAKARAEYLEQRESLVNNLNTQNINYDDVVKYEQELKQLDAKWDSQDAEFRSQMRPLQSLMPAQESNLTVSDQQMQQQWQQGVRRADREAEAALRDGRAPRQRQGVIESIGESIADGYHSLVNFLTD